MQSVIKFCSACGHAVDWKIPPGDHAPRHVCPACEAVHYLNPKIIVGVIPEAPDGRILLCKRNIEPRLGFWTFPAGFMEMGETSAEGAAREGKEESEAEIAVDDLCALINVPWVNQMHMAYRGRLIGEHFATTPESSEVRLYAEEDIPWNEIAFPTIYQSLRFFFADRSAGLRGFHALDLKRKPNKGDFANISDWLKSTL